MAEPPLVFVDACVYLDLITRNSIDVHRETGEPRWKSAAQVFTSIESGYARLAASSLVAPEVLVNGETRRRRKRSAAVERNVQSWFSSPNTVWSDIDRLLAQDAEKLTEDYGHLRADRNNKLRSADALHLAAAVRMDCDFLMTHDGGFPIGHQINKTRIVRPGAFWQQSLTGL